MNKVIPTHAQLGALGGTVADIAESLRPNLWGSFVQEALNDPDHPFKQHVSLLVHKYFAVGEPPLEHVKDIQVPAFPEHQLESVLKRNEKLEWIYTFILRLAKTQAVTRAMVVEEFEIVKPLVVGALAEKLPNGAKVEGRGLTPRQIKYLGESDIFHSKSNIILLTSGDFALVTPKDKKWFVDYGFDDGKNAVLKPGTRLFLKK